MHYLLSLLALEPASTSSATGAAAVAWAGGDVGVCAAAGVDGLLLVCEAEGGDALLVFFRLRT